MGYFSKKSIFSLVLLLLFPSCGFGLRKLFTPTASTPANDQLSDSTSAGGEDSGGSGGGGSGGEGGGSGGGGGGGPSGNHFAYVANSTSGTISSFGLDTTSGALTLMGTSDFGSAMVSPTQMVANSLGTCLFVSDQSLTSISSLAIGAQGSLTIVQRLELPFVPGPLALSNNQALLYATSTASARLMWMNVGAGCALTYVNSMETEAGPTEFLPNVQGTALFLASPIIGKIQPFILASGIPVSAASSGNECLNANSLVQHPDTGRIYVGTTGDRICIFGVAGSSLSELSGSPQMMPTDTRHLMMDPLGEFLFAVSGNSGQVHMRQFNSDGTTVEVTAINPGHTPNLTAIDEAGKTFLVVNELDETITSILIHRNGISSSLEIIDTKSVGVDPVGIVLVAP